MCLMTISLFLFSNLFILSNSKEVKTRKIDRKVDECVCFPGGEAQLTEIFNSKDLERLVVYLYRDAKTHKLTLYTPSSEKQALIPDIPFGINDKIKTITTETITSIVADNPEIFKSKALDVDDTEPAQEIGYSAGVVVKPRPGMKQVSDSSFSHQGQSDPCYPGQSCVQVHSQQQYPQQVYPQHKIHSFGQQMPEYGSNNPDYKTIQNNQLKYVASVKQKGQKIFNSHLPGDSWNPNQSQRPWIDQDYKPSDPASPKGSTPQYKFPITPPVFIETNVIKPNLYAPKRNFHNKYLTFDQWFNGQMETFQDVKSPDDIKAIDTVILRRQVQRTLFENQMLIGSTGLITDANGTPINLDNLQLRPILIGNPVTYQEALVGVKKLTLPKHLPYLEGILISLSYPPKVLGIIPLGKTYVSTPNKNVKYSATNSNSNSVPSSILTKANLSVTKSQNSEMSWGSIPWAVNPVYSNLNIPYTGEKSLDGSIDSSGSQPDPSPYSSYDYVDNSPHNSYLSDSQYDTRDYSSNSNWEYIPGDSASVSKPPHRKVNFNYKPSLYKQSKINITPIDSKWDSSKNNYWGSNENSGKPQKSKPNADVKSTDKGQSKLIITPIDSMWDSSSNSYWGFNLNSSSSQSNSDINPTDNRKSKVIITPIDAKWDSSSNAYWGLNPDPKKPSHSKPDSGIKSTNNMQPKLIGSPTDNKWYSPSNIYWETNWNLNRPSNFKLDSKTDTKPINTKWDSSQNTYGASFSTFSTLQSKPSSASNPTDNKQSKPIITPIDSIWDSSSNTYWGPYSGRDSPPHFKPTSGFKSDDNKQFKLIVTPIDSKWDISSNTYEGSFSNPKTPSQSKPNSVEKPTDNKQSKIIVTPIDSKWDSSSNTYLDTFPVPKNPTQSQSNSDINATFKKQSKTIITPNKNVMDASSNTYAGPSSFLNFPYSESNSDNKEESRYLSFSPSSLGAYSNDESGSRRRSWHKTDDGTTTTGNPKSSGENQLRDSLSEDENNPSSWGQTRRFPLPSIQGVIKKIIGMVVQKLQRGSGGEGVNDKNGNAIPRVPIRNYAERSRDVQDEERPDFRIIGGSAATGSGAPISNKGRSASYII